MKIKKPSFVTRKFKNKKSKIKKPSYVTRTSDKTSNRASAFITKLEWKKVTVSKFQHLPWTFLVEEAILAFLLNTQNKQN